MWRHHHHHHHHRFGPGRGFRGPDGEGACFAGPGFMGGFGGRGGPMGGGRGRRRMFDGGELRLVLLKLIEEQPRHGYDLIREIEARTGGAYAPSPGVVYPTLTLLADMGLAEEAPAEGGRKQLAITEAGRAHLAERADEVAQAFARLSALADLAGRTDAAPIQRAMRNLQAAIHNRLSQDGVEKTTLLDVAALIDQAASQIERL
jgi:DNA-binding PadR family transcriptional regulator